NVVAKAGSESLVTGSLKGQQPVSQGSTPLELPPALIGPLSLRLAAAKGDPSAQLEIGSRFSDGQGVRRDLASAAVWYKRSAMQGNAVAQYRLAAQYERGLGVKADPVQARAWYQRAAEKGNIKAMHNLAVMLAGSNSGIPDYRTAAHWFREAADRGLADSQYNLGILLESGFGVAKDPVSALKWFMLAAKGGDMDAGNRRDQLITRLPPSGVQAANAAVASWRRMRVIPLANDINVAGNAWKSGSLASR
ncbi:MAG: tetratricopeptide repeat protein, partial [Hyphomicrobiaceae bacterium]